MRIDVVGKHLSVTDAIRGYAESKAGRLLKIMDLTQQVSYILEAGKTDFHAEVVVDVEKHKDFVANARESDLYAAIDAATDKVARQLGDFKEKLKLGRH